MTGSTVGLLSWSRAGLWIAQTILALIYLYAGLMKISRTREALAEFGLTWAREMSPTFLRFLGMAEILSGLGVLLPAVTGILLVLIPIAAVCLYALQLGAIIMHNVRGETGASIWLNVILMETSVFVLWGYTH